MKIGEDLGLDSDYNVMNIYECSKYINEVVDELQDRTYNLVDEYFYEMKNQIFSWKMKLKFRLKNKMKIGSIIAPYFLLYMVMRDRVVEGINLWIKRIRKTNKYCKE